MEDERFQNMWRFLEENTYDDLGDIGTDMKCSICTRILINAHRSMSCGCRYCLHCIRTYLNGESKFCPGNMDDCRLEALNIGRNILPDHTINYRISRLIVGCRYSCGYRCELRSMEQHESTCGRQPASCPYVHVGCMETQLDSDNINEHLVGERVAHAKLLMTSTDRMQGEISSMRKDGADLRSEVANLRNENKLIREQISFLQAGTERHRSRLSGLILLIICGCVLVAAIAQLWMEVRDIQLLALEEKKDQSKSSDPVPENLNRNIDSMWEDLSRNIEYLREDLGRKIALVRENHSSNIESMLEDQSRNIELMWDDLSRKIASLGQDHSSNIESMWEYQRKNKMPVDQSRNVESVWEEMEIGHRELEKRVREIAANVEMQHRGGFLWRIDGWYAKSQSARERVVEEIFSEAFFSHEHGYRMCLSVSPNGLGEGLGTHLAVYFYIMRGPYDNLLSWPFKLNVTLSLIDQSTGMDYVSDTVTFDDLPNHIDWNRPTTDRNEGIGNNKLVELTALSSTIGPSQDDMIFIKCVVH